MNWVPLFFALTAVAIADTWAVKYCINRIGWQESLAHSRLPHVLVSIYWMTKYLKFNRPEHWIMLGFGCFGAASPYITYYILSQIGLSRYYPLTVLTIAGSVAVGLIFFNDYIDLQKGIGIGLSIIAVYLLTTGGN